MGTPDATATQFVKILNDNPAARSLYRALVEHALEPVDRNELAQQAEGFPRPATFVQTIQGALSTLVRVGALEETVLVNNVPYEGTRDELMDDDAISDEDEIAFTVRATEGGRQALELTEPAREIAALFAAKPQHQRAFSQVLNACAEPGGKTGREIDALLEGDRDALKYDARTDCPTVYPAYFTGALEEAGALVWDRAAGVWKATAAGLAAR